ncbi:MAG: aspartate aminotransferase family protein [Betaproteobacteria bacterium]|nr:aspartate aminotransferase family protein [Betaproteobacteria bacterium]
MGKMELDLTSYWVPFTPNRHFKSAPRILASAKDMHYTTDDGRQLLDGTSGLWCVSAGHCRKRIVDAVKAQLDTLDYAPSFQVSHPGPFMAAQRIAELAPGDLNKVFFTNSGSEAVDTALKMALAYWRAKGEGHRNVFIGRERAYHGVGFGGISVGGMVGNRKVFGGGMLPRTDHMRHTFDLEHHAYCKGEPEWGAHLADELEQRIIPLHDASNIAAVIVEPVMGSTGALIPPKGYLKRLREICDKHGLLLIFDEVITGFGRLGKPFASQYFDVIPDMFTFAKSVNNATVPMGGVVVRDGIYEACMQGPEHVVELMHGYTYSGHPLACAATLATLDLYREEDLFNRSAEMAKYIEEGIHSLKGLPNVISIRNIGMIGGVEVAPRPGAPGKRGYEIFLDAFFNQGVLTRVSGDIVVICPAFISEKKHIDQMIEALAKSLRAVP